MSKKLIKIEKYSMLAQEDIYHFNYQNILNLVQKFQLENTRSNVFTDKSYLSISDKDNTPNSPEKQKRKACFSLSPVIPLSEFK